MHYCELEKQFLDDSIKCQVILYGAFDRYNYGDNLMPILLVKYFEEYHEDKLSDIEFVFSSISKSNLSQYKCLETVPMNHLLDAPTGSTVIIVGGEVLGATIGILYTHVQEGVFYSNILRIIKRISPSLLNRIAKISYQSVWDYPYVINKKSFKNDVNVIYNTVGGEPNITEQDNISSAEYVTARDDRTFSYLKRFCNPKLVPDSVLMASSVITESFLSSQIRPSVLQLAEQDFISIQACPYKVEFTAQRLADELDKFIHHSNLNVVLLPIGYASGHDDAIFLRKVKSCSKNRLLLLDDLNVWEIMYMIIKSKAFYGTSLHGVITAMSFGVPHFSLNAKIEKLTSFLETWSVTPFDKPIGIEDLSQSFYSFDEKNIKELNDSITKAQKIIFESLDEMATIL